MRKQVTTFCCLLPSNLQQLPRMHSIRETNYNGIPLKPIGNTDNKYVHVCYNPQTEQNSHAHVAPSVDCNNYLLLGCMP